MGVGWLSTLAFSLFLLFWFVAVWNIVTSLFIEKVLSMAQEDIEDQMIRKHQKDMIDAVELKDIISLADTDHSGTLTRDEFIAFMNDPKLRCFFEFRGLNTKDILSFFEMMTSVTCETELPISAFVVGCIGMRGVASAMDLQAVGFDIKVLTRLHQEFSGTVNQTFAELKEALNTLCIRMDTTVRF